MAWARCDVDGPDGWEAALAELQQVGLALPRALAILDARMWQDRVLAPGSRVRFPAAREFARRWGWGEKRARLLLCAEETWSDPMRLMEWKVRGRSEDAARTQRGRSEDATDDGSSVILADRGRSEDAARTQRGRTEGDTRVDLPSPSPSPSPSQENTDVRLDPPAQRDPGSLTFPPSTIPDDGDYPDLPFHPPGQEEPSYQEENPEPDPEPDGTDILDEVNALWTGPIAENLGRKFRPIARSSKLGAKVQARGKGRAKRETLLDAFRLLTTDHDRVEFFRQYAGLTPETVLRHDEEYATLYQEHTATNDAPNAGRPLLTYEFFGFERIDGVLPEERWEPDEEYWKLLEEDKRKHAEYLHRTRPMHNGEDPADWMGPPLNTKERA